MKGRGIISFYIAILLLGVLLIAASKIMEASLITIMLKELGFALIIAIILIFTVERVSRKNHEEAADRLVEKINKNLFNAIYKRYIPNEVFAEVEAALLKSDVLRDKYEVNYALSEIDHRQFPDLERSDIETHLHCTLLSSFNIQNITSKAIDYTVALHLEVPIEKRLRKHVEICEMEIDGASLKPYELEKDEYFKITDTHLIFEKVISIGPSQTKEISMKAKTLKRATDMEIWASRVPSTGVRVQVSVPENYQVEATANHTQALRKKNMADANSTIWYLDHGIFPFQSVVFWWQPKKSSTLEV